MSRQALVKSLKKFLHVVGSEIATRELNVIYSGQCIKKILKALEASLWWRISIIMILLYLWSNAWHLCNLYLTKFFFFFLKYWQCLWSKCCYIWITPTVILDFLIPSSSSPTPKGNWVTPIDNVSWMFMYFLNLMTMYSSLYILYHEMRWTTLCSSSQLVGKINNNYFLYTDHYKGIWPTNHAYLW